MEPIAETPKVSFCSQIFNQTDIAPKMFETIIAQSYQNWELIVVDDGSTEDLKSLVDSYKDPRIIFHRFEENKGVPFGTNWALRKATGKYIVLAAADEIFHPDKLKVQVEFMEANPKVDCCWGLPGNGDDNFPMGPRPEWEQYYLRSFNRSKYAWLRTLVNLEAVPIGGCGLLMKKSVADELGGLDESLRVFSDHEFYCRFFEKYTGHIIPFRVASDRPFAQNQNSVRVKHSAKVAEELTYVRDKHPITPPPQEGTIYVGITCYNYGRYLKDCVESVLSQTHAVDEIRIYDDCSTDGDFDKVALEVKALAPEKIKIMRGEANIGNQEGMNYLAFTTECDWFVSVAADDTLHPRYIEKCLAEFIKDPWLEFVSSQTDFFTSPDSKIKWEDTDLWKIKKPTNKETRLQWIDEMALGNQYFGAGMYRTYAIREVGGWEKEYKVIADYQMYLKLIQRENIRVVEEDLTHTRVHGNNDSLLSAERHRELPLLYFNAKKRFYPQVRKVVIATPFYELKAFSPYVVSLVGTLKLMGQLGIECSFMEISGDSYVHRARNTICDQFMRNPDMTDLFFIDSDMSWDPNAFVKMIFFPEDIIGASYPVKNRWDAWTSVPSMTEQDGKNIMTGKPLKDGTALIDAQVLAGGFLRIKRRALEKFREKYPDDFYLEPTTRPDEPGAKFTKFFAAESVGGTFFGEDHYFCKKMKDAGIQLFIFPDVDIVHWGYKPFEGNFHQFLKAKKVEGETAAAAASVATGTVQ